MVEKNPIDLYFDMKEGRIKLASKADKTVSIGLLNEYLAMLRLVALIHQHGHWKCKSPEFYANHLLFERIYDNAAERVDGIAEKLIGLYGNAALKHDGQTKLINKMNKYTSDDHIQNSLDAEKDFIEMAEDLYNRIKEIGEMTLGLDDLIMAQSSEAETSVFLLSQAKASSE